MSHWSDRFRGVGGAVMSLIYPAVCALCDQPTRSAREAQQWFPETFCNRCETSLRQSEPTMRRSCLRCGWPGRSTVTSEPLSCPNCATMPDWSFQGIIAMSRYQDAVGDAIVAGKHVRHAVITKEMGWRLGRLCVERAAEDASIPRWSLVTHVPTHRWRQIRRGGSGTEVLARAVARQLQRPYQPLIRCVRRISKQAWLDDAGRRANVLDAFAVRRRWGGRSSGLEGRDVLLVDDVFTTGATTGELSRVLLDAGARSVWVAVVARTIRDRR